MSSTKLGPAPCSIRRNSDDLNPGGGGSNDWGVKLTFSPITGPLEVYTTDPNHRYPGNTIRSLEGQNDNRIDIDLSKVPATTGGQATTLSSNDPADISQWVQAAPKWDDEEKQAVLNFVFNFLRLRVQRDLVAKTEALDSLVSNWKQALAKLQNRNLAWAAPTRHEQPVSGGAADAFNQRPLFRASRSLVAPGLKGSEGSSPAQPTVTAVDQDRKAGGDFRHLIRRAGQRTRQSSKQTASSAFTASGPSWSEYV